MSVWKIVFDVRGYERYFPRKCEEMFRESSRTEMLSKGSNVDTSHFDELGRGCLNDIGGYITGIGVFVGSHLVVIEM